MTTIVAKAMASRDFAILQALHLSFVSTQTIRPSV
jgi:hypothetical protein